MSTELTYRLLKSQKEMLELWLETQPRAGDASTYYFQKLIMTATACVTSGRYKKEDKEALNQIRSFTIDKW